MAKIITENFRVQTANELYRSFTEGNAKIVADFTTDMQAAVDRGEFEITNTGKTQLFDYFPDALLEIMEGQQPDSTYYIMGSCHTKGEKITNSQFQKREFLRRVIFGTKVTQSNIRYMFNFNNWTSGVTYDAYDDNEDISTLNMYVTVLDGTVNEGSYRVFKCLRNNNNQPSTIAPSVIDPDNEYETETADGYVWKYMFKVPPSEYLEWSTVQSLPYYADASVIASAEENISDIIIEQTGPAIFSDHNLGTVTVENITQTTEANTWEIELTTSGISPKISVDAYTNMYIRFDNTGEVYDILSSETPVGGDGGNTNRTFFVTVRSESPAYNLLYPRTTPAQIVPKVRVSNSSGETAIAFGEVDENGTLQDVKFVSKGTEYKYATAKLLMPPALEDRDNETSLRAIVSPRGGHGSDPISELYMSKISVIASFFSSAQNAIPDVNSYSRVGLVKNPVFRTSEQPVTFDNRMTIEIDGDLTSENILNHYVVQQKADEEVYGVIHEMTYDSISGTTTLHLVDYIGDWSGTFEAGPVEIKATKTLELSEQYTINTVSESDTGLYTNYSGDLLHYVDFDAIERQAGRKEKVKFVFDF